MQTEGGPLVVVAELESPEFCYRLGIVTQIHGVDCAAECQNVLDCGVEVRHPEEDVGAGALVAAVDPARHVRVAIEYPDPPGPDSNSQPNNAE